MARAGLRRSSGSGTPLATVAVVAPGPRHHGLYALFFALFWIPPGATFPFFYPLLADRGLQPAQLGLIAALLPVGGLIAQPAVGWLCDRTGRGRLILCLLTLTSAALLPLFALARGLGQEMAVGAAYALFNAPLAPLGDALTIAYLREAGGEYGRLRCWGSFSFALAGIAAGLALRAHLLSLAWLYAGGAALSVLPALTALRFPVEVHGLRRRRTPLRELFAARPFLRFLLLATVALLAFNANGTYLSVYLGRLGGGALWQGAAWALAALVEVPFFFSLGALRARIGARHTLVLACACEVLALACIALAQGPSLVLLGMGLQGPAFALFYGAAVPVADALVPAGLRASGQSLLWTTCYGVGAIAGNGLAAVGTSALGIQGMYRGLTLFALVATAVFALGTRTLCLTPAADPAAHA